MRLASAPPATTGFRLPLDRQTVERHVSRRGEPEWLAAERLAAVDRYAATVWPSGKEEEWRRFPLAGIPAGPLTWEREDQPHVTVYEGLDAEAGAAGVVFDKLSSGVAAHGALVRTRYATDGVLRTHEPFRALADALWANGSTFLYVPRGVSAPRPLVVRKRWLRATSAMIARTLVIAEPDSRVLFVEELSSEGGGPGRLAIPRLDIHLGARARVDYLRIQRFGDDVWDLSSQRYVSGRDSELQSFNIFTGSKRAKVGVESDIRGDGATVKLYGLVAAGDEQRIDVNSLQRVDGKGSNSDLLYLSALYEAAKAVYYGLIRVEKTSSGTGSYQECRNMLLSDKASADPIPVLEILTNDVARCGHGATAGAIEDSELFYVMSRGLPRDAAERLLVRGFFQRVIDKIPDPSVRARMLEALAPRIGRFAELDDAA